MATRRRTPEENRAIVEREMSSIRRHAERSGVFSRLPPAFNTFDMQRLWYQGFPIQPGRLSHRQKLARKAFLMLTGDYIDADDLFDVWRELYGATK